VWGAVVGLLTMSVGCASQPPPQTVEGLDSYCVDLQDDPTGANHVQPYHVWVDGPRRQVWSVALETPTIAVFDADTQEDIQRIAVADKVFNRPSIVTDDAGIVWISNAGTPPLLRYDPATGEVSPRFPLAGVHALVPRVGGGVVVFGVDSAGVHSAAVVDAAGERGAVVAVEDALGIVAHPDGVLLLSREGPVLNPDDLSEVGSCPLPFAGSFGTMLPGGEAVVTLDGAVGWSDCAGGTDFWWVGVENKEVVPWGSGALVMDRIGSDDPNLGITRFVDASGVTDGFVTAKNTGFGMLDPQTGLLWANSEGTDEVAAFDIDRGVSVAAVRLGTFVDGLAADPVDPDVFVATGRLSDTVKRVVDGAVVSETHAIHWPYSPVIDPLRHRVWMVRQTESAVVGLDEATLTPTVEVPLGFARNPLLLFSTLAWDSNRDLLYFAESNTDTLVQIDPDTGLETARWALGGPLIEDPDDVGELSVQVDLPSGAVFVARTNDGRLQRIDPVSGSILRAFYDEDPTLSADRKMDSVHPVSEAGLVWFGGRAFDIDTLTRRSDRVFEAADVYFPVDDDWVLINRDKTELRRVRLDGSIVDQLPIMDKTVNAEVARITEDRQRLWFADAYAARVCGFAVDAVLDGQP